MNTNILASFIQDVHEAIRARQSKSHSKKNSQIEAEERVCLESRTLFSRFVDAFMLGGVSIEGVDDTRKALEAARACITVDSACEQAVSERIEDFEKFLKRNSQLVPTLASATA